MNIKMAALLCFTLLIAFFVASCSDRPYRPFEWGRFERFTLSFSFNTSPNTREQHVFYISWCDNPLGTFGEAAYFLYRSIGIVQFDDYGAEIYAGRDINRPDVLGRISSETGEQLRHILMENNIEKWDGFRPFVSPARDQAMRFSLRISMDTGYRSGVHINAHGYAEFPEGFDDVFPILVDFLEDLVLKYTLPILSQNYCDFTE